jgi:hypothetical protein
MDGDTGIGNEQIVNRVSKILGVLRLMRMTRSRISVQRSSWSSLFILWLILHEFRAILLESLVYALSS